MGSLLEIRSRQFADYILDVQTAELRRNGTKIVLQDQPFQILTTLIKHRTACHPRRAIRRLAVRHVRGF
jgi:DNA-binding response OmpR family regulator